MDCRNPYGTEYVLKFDNPEIDKMVAMPGDQFIDSVQWLNEFLIILTKDLKHSKQK